MAINLLPWREDRYYQRIKNRKRYIVFCIMIVLFSFIEVRRMFVVELENIKERNYFSSARFSMAEMYENRRNKTTWLIGFLANLPLAVQDDLYIGKITMREDLIKLIVYSSRLSHLEKFIEKIKKQGGIGKVMIDSSSTHGDFESDDKENKFILTLNLDNK